jgi:hypothetical protein
MSCCWNGWLNSGIGLQFSWMEQIVLHRLTFHQDQVLYLEFSCKAIRQPLELQCVWCSYVYCSFMYMCLCGDVLWSPFMWTSPSHQVWQCVQWWCVKCISFQYTDSRCSFLCFIQASWMLGLGPSGTPPQLQVSLLGFQQDQLYH